MGENLTFPPAQLFPSQSVLSFLCLSYSGDHKQKFYWGHKEILIPVFKNMADAMRKHPEVDVLINFASLRSAYDSTIETMNYAQVGPGSNAHHLCSWNLDWVKVVGDI